MKLGSLAAHSFVALLIAAVSTACGAGDPVGGTGAASIAAAPAPVSPTPKPTVVLLHGSAEDASVWGGVTRRLQDAGFPVIAPAVPLRGVASDAAGVAALLGTITGPKILVGHSYGGLLVSELAGSTAEVAALVYVAAFIPQAGESGQQLISQFPGSLLGPETTYPAEGPDGPEIYVKEQSFAELFAEGVPAADVAVAAASQRPLLAAALDERVTSTAPAEIPKFAIVATGDKAILPAAERFQAERASAEITEIPSPHAVSLANPQVVVDVIARAAGA